MTLLAESSGVDGMGSTRWILDVCSAYESQSMRSAPARVQPETAENNLNFTTGLWAVRCCYCRWTTLFQNDNFAVTLLVESSGVM